MDRPSDDELDAQLEAARVEMWSTLGRRLLDEDAQRDADRAAIEAHRAAIEARAARVAAQERAVAIVVVLGFCSS